MMAAGNGLPLIALGFIGLVAAFVVSIALWTFISGTRKRWRQCGSLWRALTEAHVTPPLGEFKGRIFGSRPARLRVFASKDGAGLVFEIRPDGFLAYARHEYAVEAGDLRPLAQALRRAGQPGKQP